MSDPTGSAPALLKAVSLDEGDVGSCEWDPDRSSSGLSVSEDGRTVEWRPRNRELEGGFYPPAWLRATTRMHLHSGNHRWDFVVEEMARAQIGVGFMLLWDVGLDWGSSATLAPAPAHGPTTLRQVTSCAIPLRSKEVCRSSSTVAPASCPFGCTFRGARKEPAASW